MIQTQTEELLHYLNNRDHRGFDSTTVASWHEALSGLDIKQVRMALASADADPSITQVTAEDIVRHHGIIAGRVERLDLIEQVSDALDHTPRRPGYELPSGKLPWRGTPAPRPANMAAMEAAYHSGDQQAVNREVNLYRGQVADAGIMSDFDAARIPNRATRRERGSV